MLLELEGVSASYGERDVIHNLGLCVAAGEIVCLLGPNAAGKTTTLKTILGLLLQSSGVIRLDGEVTSGLSTPEIVRRGVAIVPEGRRLFPNLTVEENLYIVVHGSARKEAVRGRFIETVEQFPLLREKGRWKQLAGTLSGGEQQQVAVARALLLEPRMLLLDEPSMGMSPVLVRQNLRIVEMAARKGVGVLLVEQNVKLALSVASRGYVLQQGRIILSATSSDLLANEMIQGSYLGEFVQ